MPVGSGTAALLADEWNDRKRHVIIYCSSTAAPDPLVTREVGAILAKRARHSDPPVSMAVSDAVALGIAGGFRSSTPSGQVMDRFHRTGTVDADELTEAARVEQGYASAEGHAALHCLIGWVHSRVQRRVAQAEPS
jgi:hypothetical protein